MDSVAINIDEISIPRNHKASSMIDSQLHKCVRQDSINDFKSRVQTHSAENLVTPCGNTLLHVAVSYGSHKITSYLTETFPFLITTQNSQEDTVLHLAARRGKDSDAIKSLAQSNPSLMRKANTKGNTPLHDAVINGNEEIARFLASKDPEVAYYNNNNGKSPLYLAVENDQKKGILDDLLKSGASIPIYREDGDALRPNGKSPVHAAIERRDKDILEKIEREKPELLRLSEKELGNSLHYASSIGFLEGVQFLLQKFRDGAYETNLQGNYPIHLACKSDSVDVVKECLDIFPYPEEFLNKKRAEHSSCSGQIWKLQSCYGRPNSSFLLVRDNRVGRFIVNNGNRTPYDLAKHESKSAVDQFDKSNEMDGSDNSKDVEDGMKNSTAENSTGWTSSERKDKASDLKRDTKKASPKEEGLTSSFIGVVTTLSILYFYARPKKSLREYFTVTLRPISKLKEESKSRMGNLLVVAVLIAGVTFAGAVQLPQLRDYSNSRKRHLESNSTITASHYSYEKHLYGYLFLDVGALSSSIVAALILLSASFTDARYILPAVWLAGFMVFWAIIMMFGAFFLSVRIALLGSPEVWLTIALIVVAVVFFLVQAFLFLPWFFPLFVNRNFQGILLNNLYFLSFFILYYSRWWLTEKLADLKKKLKNPQ
ncbi:hypothetical protein OIU77_004858 [Salix suchowensis]|uniref:PGG domain-containing protein n=1 Tax=Salix suchowensis TaxID=1278906 RepID=A0ABQ9AW20_9ROSI|nr:hypothetical protein OIU77_004858 [Salix suchowensis]